ncbi:MAG: acireductone synthase [Candidatus Xenobia bacterium]
MKGYLLDIEGTTTPVTFVYDTLFPYAKERLVEFLDARWADPQVQHVVELYRKQEAEDLAAGREIVPIPQPVRENDRTVREAIILSVYDQMREDRKITCLKLLQGLIWREGYERGELKADVFPDVPEAFARWKAAGHGISIYSSGSVEAQQLLFRYSTAGDLTAYISNYFDTTTGPKQESESYRRIAQQLKLTPADLVFATDIVAEASAAQDAGMTPVVMRRPGNAPVTAHGFRELTELSAL